MGSPDYRYQEDLAIGRGSPRGCSALHPSGFWLLPRRQGHEACMNQGQRTGHDEWGVSDLLRAVFFSSAVMGRITGNRTVMFNGMVSSLDTAFLSSLGSVEGVEGGMISDEGVFVSRGGAFSAEPVTSSEEELPPPKNSINFPLGTVTGFCWELMY
jgi:hypothetical protein